MRYLIPLAVAITLAAPALAAESAATETIAEVLLDLNHFPTDEDKRELEDLIAADTTTEEERALATALMNVEHKVQAGDREALQSILDDPQGTPTAKELAQILLDLNHRPSEDGKRKLKLLAGG